jgi:CRISPR-associated endonuclease/helicase Cas3
VEKAIRVEPVPPVDDAKGQTWAEIVANAHKATQGGITLAVTNTVRSARDLHTALERLKKNDPTLEGVDLRLVHSRFRGAERRQWTTEFLAREHCKPGSNRIIVATQVVEAGVDISADALVTELAPWASLAQRFGRCARYGGSGQIIIIDRRHTDESANRSDAEERSSKRAEAYRKTALPYELAEIEAAAKAIMLLNGAASSRILSIPSSGRKLKP